MLLDGIDYWHDHQALSYEENVFSEEESSAKDQIAVSALRRTKAGCKSLDPSIPAKITFMIFRNKRSFAATVTGL